MVDLKKENVKWLGVYAAVHGLAVTCLAFDVSPLWTDVSAGVLGKAAFGLAAALVAAVLTDSASSRWKHRLVYWRWKNPLPGSRAFSKILEQDESRINRKALLARMGGRFPHDAAEQNQVWYGLYKSHHEEDAVMAGNRRWLLYRDLTWLGVLLTPLGGVGALIVAESTLNAVGYVVVSAIFLLITWHAAWRNGERFVLTVLAAASTQPDSKENRSVDGV